MTTGDGILSAMFIYIIWQAFLIWLATERATDNRPARTEARLSRLEDLMKTMGIDP